MNVEERVRVATRARTDLVRDIRPLELPARQPYQRPSRPGTRRWVSWGAPIAAAGLVVALAIALVVARQVRDEPSPAPPKPAASSLPAAAGVPGQRRRPGLAGRRPDARVPVSRGYLAG